MPTAPLWWYVLRSNGRGDWHCCPLGPLSQRTKQEDDIGRRGWGRLGWGGARGPTSFYSRKCLEGGFCELRAEGVPRSPGRQDMPTSTCAPRTGPHNILSRVFGAGLPFWASPLLTRGQRMTIRRLTVLSAGLAMAALMAVIALAPPAHAALGLREIPDKTWMTNGKVYAQALSEDGRILYIGGKFNSVREKPPGTAGKTLAVNNVA